MTSQLLPSPPKTLIDQHGRQITYLRLSVTDRCDLRCRYCLPERPDFLPKSEILSLEQLLFVVEQCTALGISKIRITGGEPLVRRDLLWLLERIGALDNCAELVITTNGTQLTKYASALKQAGVKRLNVSLDTLCPHKFHQLTRNNIQHEHILAGIAAASKAEFAGLKINTVLMRGFNDDELCDLVEFAMRHNADISFIEEMPIGIIGRDRKLHQLDSFTTESILSSRFMLTPSNHNSGGPASYWKVGGSSTKIGMIAPHTRNFCTNCNRVRITCQGNLYPCLGHDQHTKLAPAIRARDERQFRELLFSALATKPESHQFDIGGTTNVLRYMAVTGG